MPTLSLPHLDDADPAVSRFELERYIAGELDAARRATIATLLGTHAALKEKHDALVNEQRAADAALRLEVPLARFLDDHAARMEPTSTASSSLFARLASLMSGRAGAAFGSLVAAGAVLAVVTSAPSQHAGDDVVPAWTGEKGGARVGFFIRDEHNARFGHDGETLGAGNQIQFAVKDAGEHAAMVLVGVDGRGAVTVYDAEKIGSERPKGESKARLIKESVVLDDSTGAERFFVVYGDGSVDDVRHTVEQAARSLASSHADLATAERLPLPSSLVQSSVHIMKVAR